MKEKNKKILIAGIIVAFVTIIILTFSKQKKEVEKFKKWNAAIKQVLDDNFEIINNVIERKRTESEALSAYEKDPNLLNAYNVVNSEIKQGKWSNVNSLNEILQRHIDFILNSKGFIFKLAYKIF